MGRKRQSAKEESHEHDSVACRRSRARFVTRDDDVSIHIGNDTGLAQFAFIARGEGCPFPIALRNRGGRRSGGRRGGPRGGRAGARACRVASSCLRHGSRWWFSQESFLAKGYEQQELRQATGRRRSGKKNRIVQAFEVKKGVLAARFALDSRSWRVP